MPERDRAPILPGALGDQFRVTALLPDAAGLHRFEVVDAAQTSLVLEVATRATLFDDPLSAFHGAATVCFGPTVPPTPIAAAARALYRCHHPTIPRPRGVGTHELRPWIITGRPSGLLLADRHGPWPEAELRALADGLFAALGHAHARGVIHRAVGPANIYWGPGGLGLVGWTAAAVDGTPPPDSLIESRWRAPESWLGAPPSVAGDLYAAGVLLHTLAAGAPPFADASAAWDHVHTAPPPLPAGTAPALVTLCERLLAKDPAQRPESARAALDLLHSPEVTVGVGPSAASAAPRSAAAASDPVAPAPSAPPRPGFRRPGVALRALDWSTPPAEAPADEGSLPTIAAVAEPERAPAAPATADPSAADRAPPPADRAPSPADPLAADPAPAAASADLPAADSNAPPTAALTPDPYPIPTDPVAAARHLLACGRPDEALRRCVDVEGARRTNATTRVQLRVLAGRALLTRGDTTRASEAFDLALHADPGPSPDLLAELADAAVEAGHVGVAVDAALRTLIADTPAGRALLARVVGRVLLRRADPPEANEMLPLAVAATHLALRAIEADEDGGPWFARGREVGQAGMMALTAPPAPVFPLHLALCAWGVGDPRGAESAVRLAREHGLRVPQTVDHLGATVCLKLALLTTHQRDRARALPDALAAWAAALD